MHGPEQAMPRRVCGVGIPKARSYFGLGMPRASQIELHTDLGEPVHSAVAIQDGFHGRELRAWPVEPRNRVPDHWKCVRTDCA
jgi:hypothetical protein